VVRYTNSLAGITPEMLVGFAPTWREPLSPERLLAILTASKHVFLAVDDSCSRVVGVVNALSDEINWAFIPFLEVLPDYRKRGIGSELVKRMLDLLRNVRCIDLTCDPEMQPFYEKLGMLRSTGMVIRRYLQADKKN